MQSLLSFCYFPPRRVFLHRPFLIFFHPFSFDSFSCKVRDPVSHRWFYVFRRFSQNLQKTNVRVVV